MDAINEFPVIGYQLIRVDNIHVTEGAFPFRCDSSISINYQTNPAFYKALIELKLFIGRPRLSARPS